MKPKLLKIKGLNSFLEEQTIDFEKLLKYGFFGIFGNTGSGKTTILDAITLALYGEISRFDKKGKNKQFINVNVSSAYVYFEFTIGNQENFKTYTIERSFKSKDGNISPHISRLIEKKDGEELILADKKTSLDEKTKELIGLSYEDFTRTVILPQGKFSEFLLLENKQRRDMLERIFRLEKYGESLSKKIRELSNEKSNSLKIIETSLSIYGNITDETLNEKIFALEEIKTNAKVLNSKNELLNQELNLLMEQKKLSHELNHFKEIKSNLDLEVKKINDTKFILNRSKDADFILPLILDLEKNLLLINENNFSLSDYTKKYSNMELEEKNLFDELELATKNRTEILPIFQSNLFKLKEAQNLLKSLKPIEDERSNLLEKHKNLKITLKKYMSEIELLNSKKDEIKSKLNKIINRKCEINLPIEFKNNIRKGFVISNEITKISKTINDIEVKKVNLEESLRQTSDIILELSSTKNSFEKELENLEKEYSELNNISIDHNYISEIKENIIKSENVFNNNLLLKTELNSISENNKKLELEINTLDAQIKLCTDEIFSNENKLLNINNEIEKSEKENLVRLISKNLHIGDKCPICNSNIVSVPEFSDDKNISPLTSQKFSIEEILKEKQNLKQNLELNKKVKINELDFFNKKSLELISQTEKYNFETEEKSLLAQKNSLSLKISELENNTKLKNLLSENISTLSKNLNDVNIKQASFVETKKHTEKILNETLESYNILKNDLSTLNEDISILFSSLNFGSSNLEIFHKWNITLNEYDLELEKISSSENQYRKNLEIIDENLNKISEQASLLDKEINELITLGRGKSEAIEDYKRRINELSDNKNPAEEIILIEKEIKNLENLEILAKNNYNSLIDNKTKISNEIIAIKNKLSVLENISSETKNNINSLLTKFSFKDSDEVISSKIELDIQNELELKISNFEEKFKSTTENINRLEKLLCDVDLQDLDSKTKIVSESFSENKKLLEDYSQKIGEYSSLIKKMQDDLENVKSLLSSKSEIVSSLDLLKDLTELFSGNKFVEFISKRQLEYITLEASGRLKEMTKGRYALELDGTDFIIRDDYNGGVRRVPKSLSGGETFMASLCLSLALSSKIQLNNKNPLEFFFLDEGFGTLDGVALDEVISSLEKLKMEQMNIGIISHSEEVKERTPVKLIVSPAKQYLHGTKVRIEGV